MINNVVKKHHILYIVVFLIIFSFVSTAFVSALTYQQEIGVNFTFNPTLNLTVSADLHINNLAPGAASDSNIINVNVLTNAINGYTLTATVGNNTTYNTRNLVHSNTSLSNTFSSIAYSATPTITTNTNLSNDTWGYSYSTNNGSTWSNYNGLPLYSDTTNVATLKETTGPVSSASGDDVKFKIAAKASASQVSGAYNNVINFNLAAKVVPQYTVQFNANGGSGTMPAQTIFRDEATMLAPISLTPPSGKVFAGWNTAANGSGRFYSNLQSVENLANEGSPITLYAQWADTLYDIVASFSKGKQTMANLGDPITAPSFSNPLVESSSSGVYEYDASVFGTASDASNDYTIYYYRGILDGNLDGTNSTYGSNGDGAFYPNYVRLGNTCWRIVRTTGSGGVKMIYNGLYYDGATAYSCANAQSNARISDRSFGSQDNSSQATYWYRNINRVGYTYNASVDDSTATNTTVGVIFGDNSNYSTTNTTNSNIKNYLENTWFNSNNGIGDYESILELSAGYCNDRTAYNSNASARITALAPYASSGALMRFGSYTRTSTPSLGCPIDRNVVDLYTAPGASNGNKQLNKPVALMTADEITLAGSGYKDDGCVYNSNPGSPNCHVNSYLRSGQIFWTMSPSYRYSSGAGRMYNVTNITLSGDYSVNQSLSIRPVISLIHSTVPSSGSGTATDPWVINAPTTIEKAYERAGATKLNGYYQMQDMTPEICNSVDAINHQTQVIDNRDNEVYWVAKLADGNCWMTQNLDHDIITTQNFYTYANTDIGHGAAIDTTATWTASRATYGTSNTTWNPGNGPESYNPGEICWDGVIASETTRTINDASVTCSDTHYHYGNYYNFLAATVTNNFDYVYLDHDKSICPAGWTLPKAETSGSSKTYKRLGDELSLTSGASGNSHQAPVYFIYSGYLINGDSSYVGSMGSYWTPQQLGGDIAILAGPSDTYGFYERVEGVYGGFPVRCVAR